MLENLKKLVSYYKPYKKVFLADMFFAIMASFIALLIPLVVRYVTAKVIYMPAEQVVKTMIIIAIVVGILILFQCYCNYYIANYGHVMGAKIEYDMRAEIFGHFQKLSFSFYDDEKVGQLMSRITSDLFDITELLHHGPENVTISVIKIIGALAILLSINVRLALIAFLLDVYKRQFWKLAVDSIEANVEPTKEMIKLRHQMVHTITRRLEDFSLNTVVSGFMEFNNKFIELAKKEGGIDKETIQTFVTLLAPFAPHIGEELWERLGNTGSVFENNKWPEADEELMKDDEIQVPVQINGKTKVVISVPADISKDDAIAQGKEALGDKLTGNIIKEIYVPGRIINIVAK